MPIFIYNSLARRKEEFIPLKPPRVNIYVCGVTVYDESHIGHARSLYIFDVVRRYLEYRGFKVKFVRNITDIDDKIINKAKELGISWKAVTKKFIDSYRDDLELLRIERGDFEPKATENIKDMIKSIKSLIDKDFAYEADGDVYFNVRKFSEYGKLSGQSIDQMQEGLRIETRESKKDPLDFALWKKSKPDEPYWMSPFGKGRPGWHIECSTMSMKYLKVKTLDIHAGGRDLIFPHHENEIAQAEALTGQPFAKYWMHNGLLTINGQKMAKSLGNFVTIKDFIAKYHDTDLLKLFFLFAHYSQPIDYNNEKIEETKKAYERIEILMQKLERSFGTRDIGGSGAGFIKPFKDEFITHMDNDFNTPRALAVLFDMVNRCNILLESEDGFKNFKLNYAMETIKEMADIFGLTFLKKSPAEISGDQIEFQVIARTNYKKQKNYAAADSIRKSLEEKGIILEDTKDGTKWRRKL